MTKSALHTIELSVWADSQYEVKCDCGFLYMNREPMDSGNEDMNAGWWALILGIAHARVDHLNEFVSYEIAPSCLRQLDVLYSATRQLVR